MASEVSICNRALQRLGEPRIVSLSDTSEKAVRACNVAYEPVRDALLRRYPWSFAIAMTQLAADSDGPEFDFQNYFTLPADCLRILPPVDHDLDWVVQGRQIATNWSAPLDLRYIRKVTDPNTMDALFREALSCQIALEICEEMTQSSTKKESIRADLRQIISEAKNTNAIERVSDELPDDDYITCRV